MWHDAPTLPLSRAPAREAAGNHRPWPADKVERGSIDRLIPDAKKARTNSDAQIAAIAASIKKSPVQSNRTDKSRLLAVLGISESEYVARFTSVIHTDWVM